MRELSGAGSPRNGSLPLELLRELSTGGSAERAARLHLSRHPEDRPELVAYVERNHLSLDWREVNAGLAEGLAILYAFTPWNTTSGIVAARRVRERATVVDVYCNDLGAKRDLDGSSTAVADPWVDVRHVGTAPPHFSDWASVVGFSEDVFAALDSSGREGEYRTLYSRATWAASHVVSAQYKIRHPDVWWTAEMSDPLSRTITGVRRGAQMSPSPLVRELRRGLAARGVPAPRGLRLFEWTEHLPYALADEVLFTNVNQRDLMLRYCDPSLADRVREIATVAPHPTPPRHLYDVAGSDYTPTPDVVNLAYFGVFYPTRGLTEVTGALALLPPQVRRRVRLHVFTDKPSVTQEEVSQAGLADVVVVNGYRPYLEFLQLTTRFDVLLVNDSDTRETHAGPNPYLPSKVSDYRGSGTPIWGVYQEGSILSGLGLDHGTPLGDMAAAATVLSRLVEERAHL